MPNQNLPPESRRTVFRTILAGVGGVTAGLFFAPRKAEAQQRITLADLQARIDALEADSATVGDLAALEGRIDTVEMTMEDIVVGDLAVGAVNGDVRVSEFAGAATGANVGQLRYQPALSTIELSDGNFWVPIEARNPLKGNVVNVTRRVNSTRQPLSNSASIILETILVDKFSSSSYLLIQGNLSCFGAQSGSMQQGWRLGSGTEVNGQSVTYTAEPHSIAIGTMAVISGHAVTGPQSLIFRYFGSGSNRPFTVYNPNVSDDSRLSQTTSHFVIWEIEPPVI